MRRLGNIGCAAPYGCVAVCPCTLAGDCPVANARIEHWQSSPDGEYYDKQRAYMFSDANGRYQFNTVWPGLRHINFIISADGYEEISTHWRWNKTDTKTERSEFDIVLRPVSD